MPDNPSSSFVLFALFLIGLFLLLSGAGILKIEKVTIKTSVTTWLIGLVLMLGSGAFFFVEKFSFIANGKSDRTIKNEKIIIHKGIIAGDVLYTRACQPGTSRAWINKFTATEVNKSGITFGRYEKADISKENLNNFAYYFVQDAINMTELCEGPGCYMREGNAVADVTQWVKGGCT